ncbi:hypothetical protein CEXT_557271 [Caerostris extrusa]|uniref:Uncharacterized protein n=1 Tax=Caerostris extrusa TaxID=172846 RepID=A0AAV4P375_CAEEX|nr:hypothetical protein CEXT_557271 [Caerostris extrusa]
MPNRTLLCLDFRVGRHKLASPSLKLKMRFYGGISHWFDFCNSRFLVTNYRATYGKLSFDHLQRCADCLIFL